MRDLGAGWCKRDFPLDGAAPIGLGGFGRCYFQFLIGADVVSVKSWVPMASCLVRKSHGKDAT
jgi:hypothetical protein